MSEFLAQALQYHGRGWCVLPMKDKRPACRWREYQRKRPDVATVRRWFRRPAGAAELRRCTGGGGGNGYRQLPLH